MTNIIIIMDIMRNVMLYAYARICIMNAPRLQMSRETAPDFITLYFFGNGPAGTRARKTGSV